MTDASAPAPHILYIDDDAGLRRLAERALARRGFAVTSVADGATGVMLCGERTFDLVAVDHYMPGLDGLETLQRLGVLPVPPPVIYVTGTDEGRVAVAALKAGAADYVVKSVGEDFYDLLAGTIENVLARTALERDKAAAEDQLRVTNARLETLLKEMNHRVANSLQLVSAMVSLQASALTGAAKQALADTQGRIAAVAQVHRRLYTSDAVESVDMQEYLGAIVDELGQTWCGESRAVTLAADPIRLSTDRAVSLGVIVNELVSNACKYAYGGRDGGEIRVVLTREGDDIFLLAVEDDGIGLTADAAPRGTGLGTRLLKAMAQSLQSVVVYDPTHTGVRATLRAALQ